MFLTRTVFEKNTMKTCRKKFGLHRVSTWDNIQKRFQVLRSHSSCLLGELCNFEFLQDIIAFLLKTVRPRNMKFCLHRVFIWVNIQKKFQVPRSHSIGEKCDANFKLSSDFSQKLCDRGT